MKSWCKNLKGNFNLPIIVSHDNEYYPALKEEFNRYIQNLIENNIPTKTVNEIKEICFRVLDSIIKYYKTNVFGAQQVIKNLLVSYENNPFVFSDIDNSFAFRGLTPFQKSNNARGQMNFDNWLSKELNFFKARINRNPIYHFRPSEMLHIPFTDRAKVKSQRFSIPGIPCMYFGTTSYVCWMELGKPQNCFLEVCSYKIEKNIKILNLVCSWDLICKLSSMDYIAQGIDYKIDMEKLVIHLLKLWPLVCSTSFQISEENRSFRSEYIISQLIMLCLSSFKIDGIAYSSKRVLNDNIAFPTSINLAIPAAFDDQRYTSLCKQIKISPTVNFEEFNKLNPENKKEIIKSYVNTIYDGSQILLAENSIFYSTSIFGQFDNYLVSLNHNYIDINALNK